MFTLPRTLTWEVRRQSIDQLLGFIKVRGRSNEITTVTSIFSQEQEGLSKDLGRYLLDLIRIARSHALQPDITCAQNVLYPYLSHAAHDYSDKELLEFLRLEFNFA